MITKQDFLDIDNQIKESIQQTLNTLKASSVSNYLLFLADGEYDKSLENTVQNLNPFTIDNRRDGYKDSTRLTFLNNFLNAFYSFPDDQPVTDDNEQRIHLELMVYSHIWESKPFLKKLHRLAHISNGEEYDWQLNVPNTRKHDFIRNNIRGVFETRGNNIAEIIGKGFHTSLRNAFAHSEYSFDTMNGNQRIWLDNCKGAAWELQEISFDDWSKRFAHSVLLSYNLLNQVHFNRTSLIADFGTDRFSIRHPSKSGIVRDTNIIYRHEHDSFNFEH